MGNLTLERGVVTDRGYVFIRFWPWGRENPPYREAFGPTTPDNVKLANFKIREYRNKVALNQFDIQKPAIPMLFRDATPIFLKKHKPHLVQYTRLLDKHFGTYYLHDITPLMVKKYRQDREKDGVSFATINKEQAILSSLFERFKEWNATGSMFADKVKLASENPCAYVTKPTERHRARQRRVSPEEWDRLSPALAAVGVNHKGLVLAPGWLLDHCKMALHSSLRLKDISKLSGKTISGDVLIDLQAKNAEKGIMYKTPLTESLRAIAMRIAARPYVNAGMLQKHFKEACIASNIGDCTFRDLRRTGLSWLDKHGTRRTVVRDRAGHADGKTTEFYVGSDTGEELEAIRGLEGAYK